MQKMQEHNLEKCTIPDFPQQHFYYLEKSLGQRKSTQTIGVPGKTEKLLITSKVTTNFFRTIRDALENVKNAGVLALDARLKEPIGDYSVRYSTQAVVPGNSLSLSLPARMGARLRA